LTVGPFLAGAASLAGATVLGGCGSASNSGSSAPARPSINQEPGNLSIYEWQGYEAAGTKAQKAYGMTVPGKSYVDQFGRQLAHLTPASRPTTLPSTRLLQARSST